MGPLRQQILLILRAYEVDEHHKAMDIENIISRAASNAFDAIHTPGIALEDRVGVIFDEMNEDREKWNSDHLYGVIHVMNRLIEMRTGETDPDRAD